MNVINKWERKGMRDNGASKVSQPLNKQDQKCIEDKSRDAQARSVKDSSFKEKTQRKILILSSGVKEIPKEIKSLWT